MINEIFSKDWCNILFEHRNKKYGAYVLRSQTGKRYAVAMSVVIFLFLLAITPVLFMWLFSQRPVHKVDPIKNLVHIDGIRLKEARPMRRPPRKEDLQLTKKLDISKPIDVPDEEKVATILHPEDTRFNEALIKDLPEDSMETLRKEAELELAKSTEQTDGIIMDSIPHYPSGIAAFVKWLHQTMIYPPQCVRTRKEGTIEVAFIVEPNGKIADPRILKSAGAELNHEVLRVLSLMPKWIPAKKDGKNIRAQVTIPIVFEMSE